MRLVPIAPESTHRGSIQFRIWRGQRNSTWSSTHFGVGATAALEMENPCAVGVSVPRDDESTAMRAARLPPTHSWRKGAAFAAVALGMSETRCTHTSFHPG